MPPDPQPSGPDLVGCAAIIGAVAAVAGVVVALGANIGWVATGQGVMWILVALVVVGAVIGIVAKIGEDGCGCIVAIFVIVGLLYWIFVGIRFLMRWIG